MEGFNREIIATEDGSHTVSIPGLGITYHSSHGAIQESRHVFIEAGLQDIFRQFPEGEIQILEMGFGTGLNAFLTALESEQQGRSVYYTTIEQYPLSAAETATLNYPESLGHADLFRKIHAAAWNETIAITPYFKLLKLQGRLEDKVLRESYQAIYYDAFAPETQPHLWEEPIFKKLFDALITGGLLTTYCSKSVVRRAMTAAGFIVKKIPGPRGKREMVRAFKG